MKNYVSCQFILQKLFIADDSIQMSETLLKYMMPIQQNVEFICYNSEIFIFCMNYFLTQLQPSNKWLINLSYGTSLKIKHLIGYFYIAVFKLANEISPFLGWSPILIS